MAISSTRADVSEVVTAKVTNALLKAVDHARGVAKSISSDFKTDCGSNGDLKKGDSQPLEISNAISAVVSGDDSTLKSYVKHGHAPGFSCASHTEYRSAVCRPCRS